MKLGLKPIVAFVTLLSFPSFVQRHAVAAAPPAGSAFTYQARIKKDGFLLTGTADLQFRLWSAASGGAPVGPEITANAVTVDKGLCSALLDFGTQVFQGEARWLEMSVRHPAGAGEFVTVSPRQLVGAAPYAQFALSGGEWKNIAGDIHYTGGNVGIGTSTPGVRLDVQGGPVRTNDKFISTVAQGTPPLQVTSNTVVPNLNVSLLEGFSAASFGRLATGQTWTAANTFSSLSNSFTGNGAGLTNVNAAQLGGQSQGFYTNASNLSSGTLPSGRLSGTYPGPVSMDNEANLFAGTHAGPGTLLTALNASNLTSGTLPSARFSGTYNSQVTLANANNVLTGQYINLIAALPHINFWEGGASEFTFRIINNADELNIVTNPPYTFHTTFKSNGRVGIGTTNPSQRLHVSGNILASGTCNCSSDARLKQQVRPLIDAADIVRELKPVRFLWRSAEYPELEFSTTEQIGFIAQDVRKVLPEVVLGDGDEFMSMDYGRLTTVLVGAVQEVDARLEAADAALQRERLLNQQQQREIEELHRRMERMERLLESASSRR